MDDLKQQEERWRELAELLGLPPEKSAAIESEPVRSAPVERAPVPPIAPRAPDPKPVAMPEVEIPLPSPSLPEEPWLEADVVMEVVDEAAEDILEDVAEADSPGQAAEAEIPEGAAAVGEEEQPRRRRRRRRGRRRGGQDKGDGEGAEKSDTGEAVEPRPAKVISEPPPARAPRENSRDTRDRRPSSRGRHRGRRDETPVPANTDPEDRWEEEPPVEELDEVENTRVAQEDDDDADTLSDWNVPSWQELIASLYRPER